MTKINSLEIENVKRVKAVKLEPQQNGLTVIGGNNNQGKTTVLDSIAWVLGGDRFKPSEPGREGSVTPPDLRVVLDNGIIVERKGKNSTLKVVDPEGRKSGQNLLDSFISKLALDLPRFMNSTSSEKAQTLLEIIGVGEQLYTLEQQEETLFNQRLTLGQLQRQKQGAADEMETYPDAPTEPVSATELIQQQQAILAKNGENQRLRQHAAELAQKQATLTQQVTDLSAQLAAKKLELDTVNEQLATAAKTVEQLQDENTEEIAAKLQEIDAINVKVRVNQAKAAAAAEADELKGQYEDLSTKIDVIRADKLKLLDGANLPLPGLSVDNKELVYNGHKWDGMSSSEQLKVATAIVRRLNPECGFVLVDKLEQMDLQTLTEFGTWAEAEGLQVIATRVSTGDECSIVIEDGYSKDVAAPSSPMATPAASQPIMAATTAEPWKNGGGF